ncbi:helix-turn-helix domain-containing protein [Lactococcus cremoris]|uniref:helix-turn-helix domain-containing protein n=1 Tax=Lactococcus lactis subsp. cremoris TaxID=1359 RepID=UPI0003AB6046|nr:helix-turn-helix domain-containing protein [Lactococcus cremoris]AGV72760.1 Mga-like regulatory protein [Lactococcus cremoris subsp. cremoris KW2]
MKVNKKYIEQFYGKEIYYEFLLLEYLYEQVDGYEMGELIEVLRRNRRTIAKYIDQINSEAIKLIGRKAIIFTKKKRYVFSGNKQEGYILRVAIIEDSPILSLAIKFLSNSQIVFDKYCTENYLAESTARRKITEVNKVISTSGVQVCIQKNRINLIGEEKDIRLALISFLWSTYRGVKWPFPNLSKKKLSKKLEDTLPEIFGKMCNSRREKLLLIFGINILRSESGYSISKTDSLIDFEDLILENSIFDSIKNNFLLSDSEVKFLIYFIMLFPEYNFNAPALTLLKKVTSISAPLSENIEQYIDFVKLKHPELTVESHKWEKFLSVLFSELINIKLFNNTIFKLSSDYLDKQMKKEYPQLFEKIEKIVYENNLELERKVLDSLPFAYVHTYISVFSPHDFEEEIKIGLETDMPIFTEGYIEQTLKTILQSKFNISFGQIFDAKDQFDLILNTNQTSTQEITIPEIMISPEILSRDIFAVYSACEQIVLERMKSRNKE